MSDEPQPSASSHMSISGSAISGSTVNQTTHVGDIHQAHPWYPWPEPSVEQARLLLDAMPCDRVPDISPLPSCSRMPFAPNPHFVGRDEALLSLAMALHGGARVAIGPKAAVAGIGGVGKTSVAVEVAHRLGSYFAGGVFWLSFADPAAIPSEIAACGGPGLLDLHPAYGDLKQDEQLALVRQAWQRPIPRLLIFDNCDSPELVRDWAPTSGGCRVLITSRRQSWPSALGMTALSLDVLARPASVALLRDLAPRLTPAEAEEIAEELGDFPLALQLAGSYLEQFSGIKVASYLAELRSDVILTHPSLCGVHDGDVSTTAHERHVERTFLVSYQRLDSARDALALALLARAACLAPGAPIPDGLLLASAGLAPEDTAGQMALGRLADLGFVMLGDEGVFMHRLVHVFVGVVVRDDEALAAVERVLNYCAYTINMAGYPSRMQPFLPHLWWATRERDSRHDEFIATLCTNLGYYLRSTGAYASAQPLMERALSICEQIFGGIHPSTALCLNNIALLLEDTGDFEAALPLFQRSLIISEQTLGPTHFQTAASLNNLAELLRDMGKYDVARPLYERALTIRKQTFSVDHPAVTEGLNNLAILLFDIGDYAAARPLFEQALAIAEQTKGPMHPDTATGLDNLAGLLMITEEQAAAKRFYERALTIREEVLGPFHPQTALSLHNLAEFLRTTGAYGDARLYLERALAIREQIFAVDHPVIASTLMSIASVLTDIGDYTAAQPLFDQALRLMEQKRGPVHSDVAIILNHMVVLSVCMKEYEMARILSERALFICEQSFGSNHPHTKTIQENLQEINENLQSKMKDTL